MPLDAICLRAVLHELRPQLIGARIDKVQQPARDQIVLLLRGNLRLRQIVRVIHASDFQHELDVVSRLSCRHCQLVCNHGIILFHPVWPVNIC